MIVYVNNFQVIVFEGARVQDALNKYFSCAFNEDKPDMAGLTVYDCTGNLVMPDGSLNENDHIYLKHGRLT